MIKVREIKDSVEDEKCFFEDSLRYLLGAEAGQIIWAGLTGVRKSPFLRAILELPSTYTTQLPIQLSF